jgi:hypothetical protein
MHFNQWISKDRDPNKSRNDLFDELQTLAAERSLK